MLHLLLCMWYSPKWCYRGDAEETKCWTIIQLANTDSVLPPTSSVTFQRIVEQTSICVYRAYSFSKWPIISLDRPLFIVWYVIVLWSCTENCHSDLQPLEITIMERIRETISSKNIFYFRRNERNHEFLGWHGGE